MKSCFCHMLLGIIFIGNLHAQMTLDSEVRKFAYPFKDLKATSLLGKNFYFNNNWVRARVLTSHNSVLSNDAFYFNFDKLDRRLLATADYKTVYEIDHREFKEVLFYWRDSVYLFKHIVYINDRDLFQVIIETDGKYCLYKVTRAKITKGPYDMVNNLAFSPRPDQYHDLPEYYVFFPDKEFRKTYLLGKENILNVFKLKPDYAKLAAYMLELGDKPEYEEGDLIQMVRYLNQ